jgi:hypothetical protein
VARTPAEHSADSRQAAHTMWSGVADRNEHLRNAHNNSPSGQNWHARRLFGRDVDLDSLTPTQWAQVDAARRAYLRAMSMKATKMRRLRRAQRLEDRAATIRAEVAEAGDTP